MKRIVCAALDFGLSVILTARAFSDGLMTSSTTLEKAFYSYGFVRLFLLMLQKKNMIKMEKNCFFADLINKLFFGFFLNMTYNENKESLSLSENSSFFFYGKV